MSETNKKRILIVEDEDRIRQIIKIIIRDDQVEIDEADNGKTALEKILGGGFNLVILDLMIPEMSGWDVLHAVRENEATKELPVVIVSALSSDKDILQGMKEGANFYVPKPFEPQELVNILELILGIKY